MRDSNLELFRIITMFFIVTHHFVVNSGLTATEGPIRVDPLCWRSLFLLVFGVWGKIGINCFVLITGYFMCTSHITARKFVKLLCEWLFYRYIIGLVFYLTGYEQLTWKSVLNTLIPIRILDTGFTETYIVFFLLIPFLNILVQNMDEKTHIKLLLWCGFTYVLFGTLLGFYVTMNYISWFSVLYIIASYVRLYPKAVYQKKNVWLCMTAILVVVDILSVIGCAWAKSKLKSIGFYFFVADSNTFLAVATGLSSFLLFKNLQIKYNPWINAIAASTFGVLLIHAISDTMRQWLWKDVLNVVGHYSNTLMPLYAVGSVFCIYVVCTLIDRLRILFVEKPFFVFWDKHWDKIEEAYRRIECSLLTKLGCTTNSSS